MSPYAFWVQRCRSDFDKKNPGEQIEFKDFAKLCSEKWKVSICSAGLYRGDIWGTCGQWLKSS